VMNDWSTYYPDIRKKKSGKNNFTVQCLWTALITSPRRVAIMTIRLVCASGRMKIITTCTKLNE